MDNYKKNKVAKMLKILELLRQFKRTAGEKYGIERDAIYI